MKEFDVIVGMGEASWEGEQMKTKYDTCVKMSWWISQIWSFWVGKYLEKLKNRYKQNHEYLPVAFNMLELSERQNI